MARHGNELLVDALVGLLHAQERQLEGPAWIVESHPVATEHVSEDGHELGREAGSARFGLVQVTPEFLEWRPSGGRATVDGLARPAEERLEISEGGEGRLFTGQGLGIVNRYSVSPILPVRSELPRVQRADVEAEQQLHELGQGCQVALPGLEWHRRPAEQERFGRYVRPMDLLERIEPDQRCTRVDLSVHHREELAYHARHRRLDLDLHLHGLHTSHWLASRDALAGPHRQRHHDCGHGRAHDAAGIADKSMGNAIHQHEESSAVGDRQDVVAAPLPDETPLEHADPFQLHLDRCPAQRCDPVGPGVRSAVPPGGRRGSDKVTPPVAPTTARRAVARGAPRPRIAPAPDRAARGTTG